MENHLAITCHKCPANVKEIYVKKRSSAQEMLSGFKTVKAIRVETDMEMDSDVDDVEVDNSKQQSQSLSIRSYFESLPSTSSFTPTANSTIIDETSRSPGSSYTSRSSTTPSSRSLTKMTNFCDRMSSNEQTKCTELLARAIYATCTPLSIVENTHWKNLFSALRPIWKLPSRYEVSNPLLNAEYNRVKELVDERINTSTSLGLMCDGWTNINQHSIVNFVITTPEPVFYKSLATGSNSHTGQYMSDIMINVMEEIGIHKFAGIVTDNALNMKSAWKIITEKHEHITAYGCIAHGLNLLVNDLAKIKSLEKVISDSKCVVKEILGSPLLKAVFKETQKNNNTTTSLKLPVNTRWGTQVFMMESLLANKKTLKQMAIDDESNKQLSKQSKNLAISDIFWDRISNFYILLKPVVDYITQIEGDKPQISSVCKIFYEFDNIFRKNVVKAPVLKSEEEAIFKILAKRREFCITNLHRAANILDPKYLGAHLKQSEELDAVEYISQIVRNSSELNEQTVLSEYADFKTKSGVFSKQFLWSAAETTANITWWKAFFSGTMLSEVAVNILSLPATSAACERSFSTYSNIHTSKRNRLDDERASKIVFVNHNLKLDLQQQRNEKQSLKSEETVVDHIDVDVSESDSESINSMISTGSASVETPASPLGVTLHE